MRVTGSGRLRWLSMVLVGWVVADLPAGARGQGGSPQVPPNTAPPRAAAPPSGADRELLDRLKRMEQRLDRVTKQNEDLSQENKKLAAQVQELSRLMRSSGRQGGMAGAGSDLTGASGSEGSGAARVAGGLGGERTQAARGGSKTSGDDPTVTGRAQGVGNRHLGKLALSSHYDYDNDGFRWATKDEEFTLGVRAMTQLDARIYQQANQNPVSGGFYNPRSRVYFEGRFTKPIQYEFSFQNFYDTVQLLDAYVNFNYDPRLQLRIGRYKTPFTYEYYRIHIWDLLAPERSLFASNYEGNRRFGLMALGDLFDERLEYAVGTFDSQRNSFQPFNNLQDVMAFLNFKPFYDREQGFLLRDLQVGGSVDAGHENQPLNPAVLRTGLGSPSGAGVNSSAAVNTASVPFLAFNPGVMERGARALWELHAAYYHGGLSLIGAWQGGYESYAVGDAGRPSRIPIGGWFAQAGYILTGETIRDRTLIDPLRPFDLRPGRFGLGAFEVTARYSELDLNPRVFTAGLADPNLWTNRAEMTDVGFNWYLNKFIKIYFDWEHAMFAQPVFYRPGPGLQKTSDLFWFRTQVYF
jgi:phosphate-selective porin OprO and OprP